MSQPSNGEPQDATVADQPSNTVEWAGGPPTEQQWQQANPDAAAQGQAFPAAKGMTAEEAFVHENAENHPAVVHEAPQSPDLPADTSTVGTGQPRPADQSQAQPAEQPQQDATAQAQPIQPPAGNVT